MFRPRSIGLLLALITLLVYLPATTCQFINFDDNTYVTDNKIVQKGITWEGVKWAFDGFHVSNWHPLTWISHMLDCDLFRLNPAGPHLINILFHSVDVALLFWFLFLATKQMWPSALVAALFAWHPLHVESVAWVAERKDVLCTFFTLLTLLSYTRYVQSFEKNSGNELVAEPRPILKSSSANYALAAVFFLLALLSKPMAVTLPCVMLLLDFWPFRRLSTVPITRLFLEKMPFMILSAGLCVITIFAQQDATSTLIRVPMGFRLENAMIAYAGYLWKMVWPVNLGILYPLKTPVDHSLVAESAIILIGISVIVWLERKRSPWLVFGWLWYLTTLIPVIGLIQVGSQSMADRYTYFPLIGIFVAIAFTLQIFIGNFGGFKKWCVWAIVLISAGCCLLTERQLRYWHDSESLFVHSLEVSDSASGRINLGVALQDQNRKSEAMAEYLISLEINSEFYLAYNDIAKLLNDEGKFEAAAAYYQEAIKRNYPPTPFIYENYGIVLVNLGRLDEAIKQFSTVAQIDSQAARPHFLIGRVLLQQGKEMEALKQLKQALQLEPDNLEILIYTASVMASDEDSSVRNGAQAGNLAAHAVELTQAQQPAALDVLAMSYAEMGKFDDAVAAEQQAIQLAEAAGQTNDLPSLKECLRQYQAQKPWRESFKKK